MTTKKKNTQKHMKRKSPRKNTRRRTSRKSNRKFQKWQLALIAIGVLLIAGVTGLHLYSHPTQIGSGKYTHAAKFDNALIIDGIDVSYAQGDGASHNWNQVKRSGVDFVFIRAGYRDSSKGNLHADSEFKENIQGARKAGLMVGIYFYSQATTKKEAREEAQKLVNAANGYQIDLPLVMDYELYPKGRLEKFMNGKKYKAAKGTEIAEAFCQVVREAGYEPSVYSNYNLLMHKLNPKEVAGFARVWSTQLYILAGILRGNGTRNFRHRGPELLVFWAEGRSHAGPANGRCAIHPGLHGAAGETQLLLHR